MSLDIGSIFRKIYFNKTSITEKDMCKSRALSIFEGCTARTILILTSGAFLVGYAKYLGASDRISGIISAVPALAGTIAAVSPLIFERLQTRKLLISILYLIGRLSLGGLIFIPFFLESVNWRISLLIGVFLFANLALAFTLPAAQSWILNLTPQAIRGKYFGLRESYVLGTVTIISLIMGRMLDSFKHLGNEFDGFKILFGLVSILAVFNFIFASSMREQPLQKNGVHEGAAGILTLPFKNRQYAKVVVLLILWNASSQLSIPFTYVYMVSNLKLGYTYITLMAMIASVTSVLTVRLWGKMADRKSWIYLMKLMVIIQAGSHLAWFFINKDTALILIPISHILSGAAIAGTNIAVFNIQFSYAPENYKTVYMGFSSAAGALAGFTGTLAGSVMVGITSAHGLSLFGISIGNIQELFGASCLALLICLVFMNYFFKDMKR